MKHPNTRNKRFYNEKNFILLIVFSILTVSVVLAIIISAAMPLKNAADAKGFTIPESISASAPSQVPPLGPNIAPSFFPKNGDKYATLSIDGTAVDCNLYYNDSENEMAMGAGTYTGGRLPGENGTVLVAGHTGSYFRDFESAKLGAQIVISTDIAKYFYEIEDMQVIKNADESHCRLDATEENIVLYTCYPFGQLQITDERYFIYGKFLGAQAISFQEPNSASVSDSTSKAGK